MGISQKKRFQKGSEYYWKNDVTYGDLSYQEYHDAREFKWNLDGSGRHMNMDESWGSRLDVGLMVPQMDSPLDENGNPTPTPWISSNFSIEISFKKPFVSLTILLDKSKTLSL